MHLARHKRSILFGVAAALVAMLIVLVGCTMVGDSLTGLSLSRANPSVCLKACVESQDNLVKAEASRHQAAIRACQALPEPEQDECAAAEAVRHAAAMAQISAGRQECMNACHRQGSGSAG